MVDGTMVISSSTRNWPKSASLAVTSSLSPSVKVMSVLVVFAVVVWGGVRRIDLLRHRVSGLIGLL